MLSFVVKASGGAPSTLLLSPAASAIATASEAFAASSTTSLASDGELIASGESGIRWIRELRERASVPQARMQWLGSSEELGPRKLRGDSLPTIGFLHRTP